MSQETLQTPFLAYLGARVTRWEDGEAELRLTVQPHHTNRSGIAHGGVLATLLDTACGYSGVYADGQDAPGASTVTLSINYLARAQVGDELIVHGRRTGGGRRIFFAQAEVRNGDGETVATASGAFRYASAR